MKKFCCLMTGAVFLAVAAFGMTACGDRSGGPESTSDTVRICVDSTFTDVYTPMFEAFEQATGYHVSPIWTADITNRQDTMIGSKDYPDIIVGGDLHIEKYARVLMDLTFLKDDAEYAFDDFYENLITPLQKNGELLFVPRFFNTGLLYYNKALITDTADYPTSDWKYENFWSVAQKYSANLTAEENSRYYGCVLDNYYWSEWATLVRQAGGELMDADGYITLDTDAARLGIELFAKNSFGFDGADVYAGTLRSGSSAAEVYLTVNEGTGARIAPNALEKSFEGFGSGRYVFQYGGHTQNIPIYRNMNIDFDVELLPAVKNADGTYSRAGGELSIDALGIYKNTKAYDAAVAFIKFMTGKEGIRMQAASGYMPPRESIANELLAVPKADRPAPQNLEAVFGSLQYNRILPNISYFIEVMQDSVQPKFGELMNKVKTVADVASTATDDANNYIDLMYK